MTFRRSLLLFYSAAILVFLAGAIFTILAFAGMPAHTERLNEKKKTLAALRELERERNHGRSAVLAFESADSRAPAPMGALASSRLSGMNPEIRVRETIALSDGWSLSRLEIVCSDADLARLPAFLLAAESGRPPWKLTEFTVAASRKEGGYGRATMAMESLAKSQ